MNCLVLVFSRNRALQLDATLRSFFAHCTDAKDIHIRVLYTTSDSLHAGQYQELERAYQQYPFIRFVREQHFRSDVLATLATFEHVLFLVDDNLFVRGFSLQKCLDNLASHPDALACSLRLGRNTTYCYSLDFPQDLPSLEQLPSELLKYRWPEAQHDFGYPLEISSSVYRVNDIYEMIANLEFMNPNTFEGEWAKLARRFAHHYPFLLCYEQSVTFCNPLNLVQETSKNRASQNPEYTSERLADQFAAGKRVNVNHYHNFTPQAVHQEVELKLELPGTKSSGIDDKPSELHPTVSVVIPCYNQAEFLQETVLSVIGQSYRDWEIVLVDDGSTDNSFDVVNVLIQQFPSLSIRVLQQSNQGLATARNTGIKNARGKYILPLDADDWVHPEMLQETVTLLDSHSEFAIAYPDTVNFGVKEAYRQTCDELDLASVCRHNCFSYCALYRREVWEGVGGYNPNMVWGYEDWDFWIGCAERGYRARRVPLGLFLHRLREGTMYDNALRHDKELRARIVLNHPTLYDEETRRSAAHVWEQAKSHLSTSFEKTVEIPKGSDHSFDSQMASPSTNDSMNGPMNIPAFNPHHEDDAYQIDLARVALNQGKLDEANEHVSIVLARTPSCPEGLLVRGVLDIQYERYKEATEAFQAALQHGANDRKGRMGLSMALLGERNLQQAWKVLSDILGQYPDDVEAIHLLIRAGTGLADWESLSQALDKFISRNPANCDVRFALAGVLCRSGHIAEARVHYDMLRLLTPSYEGLQDLAQALAGIDSPVERESAHTDNVGNGKGNFGDAEVVQRQLEAGLPPPTPTGSNKVNDAGEVLNKKYVNICMVTYNRLEFTKPAIASIQQYTHFPHVLTVVDNGSTDGTREYLQTMKQKGVLTNLVLLEKNVGVAKASNLAWHQAPDAEYYLKIDNDIVIQKPDWLTRMVKVIDGIPELGAIAYNFEPQSYEVRNTNGYPVRIKNPGNLNGACILIPKRTERKLGYWCEDYGLYGEEDADYGERIILAGLQNAYMEDEAIGLHLPAGRAAHIDAINYKASDGIEEHQYREYREFKDSLRKRNVKGEFQRNVNAYRAGRKSLYVRSGCVESLNKGRGTPPSPGIQAVKNKEMDSDRIGLAREALKQGKLEEVHEHLSVVLTRTSHSAEGLLLQGVLEMQSQRFTEAIEAFQSALQYGADDRKGRIGLSLASLGAGNSQRAWNVLNDILAHYPDDSEAIHLLIRAGTALADWKGLSLALERFVARNPADCDVRFALAGVHFRCGHLDKAWNHYEALQLFNPEYEGLKDLVQVLNHEKDSSDQPVPEKQKANAVHTLFDSEAVKTYYQPPTGNTEKFIQVLPIAVIGSTIASHHCLKDYCIQGFGKGMEAVEGILPIIFQRQFQQIIQRRYDMWDRVAVATVKCKLVHADSGVPFSSLKPKSLEEIDSSFAQNEGESRRKDIHAYLTQLRNGKNFAPPLYIGGAILTYLGADAEEKAMYMLDGARRISAYALHHEETVEIQVLLFEEEIANLLRGCVRQNLQDQIQQMKWFTNYHSLPFVGIQGQRSLRRFDLIDKSLLKDSVILDFGCNLGQASLKAIQAGAKTVWGIDGMKDTLDIAREINSIAGCEHLNYLLVDFNGQDFDQMIDQQVPEKCDYSFFFSVYRTKELTQRDRLFQYILNKTRKGVFFEGHAHPQIDTLEYYDWLFDSFHVKYTFLGYSEQQIRPLFYLNLEERMKQHNTWLPQSTVKARPLQYTEAWSQQGNLVKSH